MTYAVYELTRDGEVYHGFISKATNLYDAFHEAIRADNYELTSAMTDPVEIKQDLQTRAANTEVKIKHAFRPNENAMIARAIQHLDYQPFVEARIKEVGDPDRHLETAQGRAIFGLKRALNFRLCDFSLVDSRTYRRANSSLLSAVISCDEVCMRLMPQFAENPRLAGFHSTAYNTQRPQLEM